MLLANCDLRFLCLNAGQVTRLARRTDLKVLTKQAWLRQRCARKSPAPAWSRAFQLTASKTANTHPEGKVVSRERQSDGGRSQGAGILALLPKSIVPYVELARYDKPAGAYYLFFPCLFSTLLAAPYPTAIVEPVQVISTSLLFFAGALIMRGAGCTINDLWDRNLDRHVERTKNRPIARGAITPQQGIVFTGFQLLAGLVILLQFPAQCFFYATPSLLLVTVYPLAKRVTNYPQAVLGLTFSWGAFVGFPALGIDLINDSTALIAAAALYSSCWAWTIVYDMIYAHMDLKDDPAAGIKSIALAHEHNTKAVLSVMSIIQVGLLATAGLTLGAGPAFFAGSCGGAAATLAIMIWRVRLKDVKNCWWWFRNGALITGGMISAGMFADYAVQYHSSQHPRREGLTIDASTSTDT